MDMGVSSTSADGPLPDERAAVVTYARRMVHDRLVVGTSGNVSIRVGDLVAVTPSGVDYDSMTADDIPVVDLEGNLVHGLLKPTTELPMHLTCYTEYGAVAVVHTHSAHATAVSLVRDEVPAVHYQLAMFGGSVRVAPYATYGTAELAANMSAALKGRTGCLLRNHGTMTHGATLGLAYDRARQLDWLCQVWLMARAAGDPVLLPQDELDRVVAKFGTYGQPQAVDAHSTEP
jgi:L-fuculose-phosphate aldolase